MKLLPYMTTMLIAFVPFIGAASRAAEAQSGLLEEVIVTAERRAANVNEVPISVTAFDGDVIDELNFDTAIDVVSQVPNFTFTDPGVSPLFTIRGNGLIDVGDGNEAPVALYLDEVYKGTLAGAGAQMFDVERIEVLRGPQGTLFGRNSTGGLVHFISRAPTEELEGYGSIQFGSFDQIIATGAVGGPIGEGLRGRFAFKYNKDNGYQENAAPAGGDFAANDVFSARGQIAFDLSPDADVNLNAWLTRQRNTYQGFAFLGRLDPATLVPGVTGVQCSVERVWAGECVNLVGFGDPDLDDEVIWTERTDDELFDDLDAFGATAKLNWSISDNMDFVSITAYEEIERSLRSDDDSSAVGVFGTLQLTRINDVDAHQFSQEFRLWGSEGRFSWLGGVFYFSDEKDLLNDTVERQRPTRPFNTHAVVETESWAVFGQVDFDITDSLAVTAGLRYTHDDKTDDVQTFSNNGQRFEAATYEIDSGDTSGRLALDWRKSEDFLWYASVTTGFKSGEFTTAGLGGNVANGAPVADETVVAYETGIKTALFDGRAQFNTAVFYNDISDKQARATYSLGSNQLINAGDLKTYGVEFELTAQPVDALEFVLGLGLLETELHTPPDVLIPREWTGVQFVGKPYFLDGNEMQGAPNITVNGIVRYHMDLQSTGRLTWQADFRWQDDQYLDIANSPYDKQEDYGVLNLRAFWRSPSERYNVSVFVENVADEEWYSRANSIGGLDWRFSVWGSKPRWFGVKAGVDF